jgi:hypothetical protein
MSLGMLICLRGIKISVSTGGFRVDDFIQDEIIHIPKSKRTICLLPKKVYVVDIDNGESYEDFRHWISKVFTTYRTAVNYLLDQGYEPFPTYTYTINGQERDVAFYWQESDEYMADSSIAKIIEMELEK